ncbi:MAG: sensor histidine kinase [bacterium]
MFVPASTSQSAMSAAKSSKISGISHILSVIDGQELERQRLSRELHDGIGQSLIAIKMKLDSLTYMHETEIKAQLEGIKRQFDQIIDEIRRITTDLMPPVLDEFGLVIALFNLCEDTSRASGIEIKFEHRAKTEKWNKKIQTYLYRIIQEAIHNIVKHSSAKQAYIKLQGDADAIYLSIQDNGVGFRHGHANPESQSGHGLHNIKERVKLLRGTFDLKSAPGKGTLMQIKVPQHH